MPLAQIRALPTKPDLISETYEALKAAIVNGDLPPGTPLAQEDLAARFEISRQPVSHALVLLRHEGLVVERGRKGQMVAPIDPDRLLHLYQVRGTLDRLAARLTALRCEQPGETRSSAETKLEIALQAGEAALTGNDAPALVETDMAFHAALYELSGNPEIAATASTAWPHMVRSMRAVLDDEAYRAQAWAEHYAIADAVLSGKADRAGTLATRHAEAAGEATYRRLSEMAQTSKKTA